MHFFLFFPYDNPEYKPSSNEPSRHAYKSSTVFCFISLLTIQLYLRLYTYKNKIWIHKFIFVYNFSFFHCYLSLVSAFSRLRWNPYYIKQRLSIFYNVTGGKSRALAKRKKIKLYLSRESHSCEFWFRSFMMTRWPIRSHPLSRSCWSTLFAIS